MKSLLAVMVSLALLSGCAGQSAIVDEYDFDGNVTRRTYVAPDPQVAYQETARIHSQEQTKQVAAYMDGMTGMLTAAKNKGVSNDAMAIIAFVAVQHADKFTPAAFTAERSPNGYDIGMKLASKDGILGAVADGLPTMFIAREAGKTLRTFADGSKGDTTTVTASDNASVNFEQTNQDQEIHATAVGDGASAAVSGATMSKGGATSGTSTGSTDGACEDNMKPATYGECVARSRECGWTNGNGTNISHWNGTGIGGPNATDCEGRFGVSHGSEEYNSANSEWL